jgi:hypothetical protein
MSLRLIVGALLFAGLLISPSWAQSKADPQSSGPPYPGESDITFQWDYSCPNGGVCSFNCVGPGGASHVKRLTLYLGTILVGKQNIPALLYDFSTQEVPRANGFSVSTGMSQLSCQVNGLVLDYSGPPRDQITAGIKQTNTSK